MSLSALVLTYNEEENIKECLETLRFCDEVLVIDSYSSDRTVEIAKNTGATVISNKWPGFAQQRQFGIEKCSSEWVLMVDADERVTEGLEKEIIETMKNGLSQGYEIPRRTFAFGCEMKHMWPGRSLRLFIKSKGRMTLQREVHEKVIIDGDTARLKEPMLHYSYTNIAEYIKKMNIYSTLLAKQKIKEEPGLTVKKARSRAVFRFWHRFLDKLISRGAFLDGKYGFYLSLLTGISAMSVEFKIVDMLKGVEEEE